MRAREPTVETMEASRVKEELHQILSRVSHTLTRVLIEEDGKPVGAIVSREDLMRLNQLDAKWDEGWQIIDDIRATNRDKTPEEVERDVTEALAAVRKAARKRANPQPER